MKQYFASSYTFTTTFNSSSSHAVIAYSFHEDVTVSGP